MSDVNHNNMGPVRPVDDEAKDVSNRTRTVSWFLCFLSGDKE